MSADQLPEPTEVQRQVIESVVDFTLNKDEWISGRRLRASLGRIPNISAVIDSCVPTFLKRQNEPPNEHLAPTLPGLLASAHRSLVSRTLTQFIDFMKTRFDEDPDFGAYTFEELKKFDSSLERVGASRVRRLIDIAGMGGSGTFTDTTFKISTPGHIETIVGWSGVNDLIQYSVSNAMRGPKSDVDNADRLLDKSQRAWLQEYLRRKDAGEAIAVGEMRVKLRDTVAAGFTSNQIDRQLFYNGEITAIGLWLIDRSNRRLRDANTVAQWVKNRITGNPRQTVLQADEIATAVGLPGIYVSELLYLLTTLGPFWDSHTGTAKGRIAGVSLGGESTVAKMLDFVSVDAEVRAQLARLVRETSAERTRLASSTSSAHDGEYRTGHTYQRREQIGQGAVGVVYRAVNDHGDEFALKVLKPEHVGSSREKRFTNEFYWCWNQANPNIVRVLDWGLAVVEGVEVPFYVSRLYPTTLRRAIKSGMAPDRILRAFRDITAGVAAAHRADVWHRDLKPENVFIDADGPVVIGDFGIAHFQEDALATLVQTDTGDRLANFMYAAPEQRTRNGKVNDRADVFALGSMLNEMFTKAVPQGSGYLTIASVSSKHAELDALVDKMRQQDAGSRPSINDVRDSMAKWWG